MQKKGQIDGGMDGNKGKGRRWPLPHANLLNIVREVTLRSEECWGSPQTANRNNGAVLIVTLQSSTASDQMGID